MTSSLPLLQSTAFAVGSPEWFRDRLYQELKDRRRDTILRSTGGQHRTRTLRAGLDTLDDYYRGEPRLPWLPQQAEEEFHRLLDLTGSNYMGLVCDATAERIEVLGLRFGQEDKPDGAAWTIWQANQLDAWFDTGVLEAVKLGRSYLLVAPNPGNASRPLITTEHPTQAIVCYEPGTRRRAAGLKAWRDDWTGADMVTLYLPDAVYKWRTRQLGDRFVVVGVQDGGWVQRTVPGETWPAPNPLGAVPLIEVPNRPAMLTGGVSEIADVISDQDRICKTLADRLMTQDFGAFPQRWAIGYPAEDKNGNPQNVHIGRNRLITTDVPKDEALFGQWTAADLGPYMAAISADVKAIASRTRTPSQYLLGEMVNTSGDALKAAESGLVAKVLQRRRFMGEAVEEAFRLAFKLAGDDAKASRTDAEVVWKNPEFRTVGELVDALIKLKQAGCLPVRAVLEEYGYSPTRIEELMAELERERAADPLAQIAAAAAATGQPVPPEPAGLLAGG